MSEVVLAKTVFADHTLRITIMLSTIEVGIQFITSSSNGVAIMELAGNCHCRHIQIVASEPMQLLAASHTVRDMPKGFVELSYQLGSLRKLFQISRKQRSEILDIAQLHRARPLICTGALSDYMDGSSELGDIQFSDLLYQCERRKLLLCAEINADEYERESNYGDLLDLLERFDPTSLCSLCIWTNSATLVI